MEKTKELPTEVEGMSEIGRVIQGEGKTQVVYRLFRKDAVSDCFGIVITSEGECAWGMICGTLSFVSKQFEKIANGAVRPYILHEILDDLESAKI